MEWCLPSYVHQPLVELLTVQREATISQCSYSAFKGGGGDHLDDPDTLQRHALITRWDMQGHRTPIGTLSLERASVHKGVQLRRKAP